MDLPALDASNARSFAVMLRSGLPPRDAMGYFAPDADEGTLISLQAKWLGSRLVRQALTALDGGPWTDLDNNARIDLSLKKHYAELAYFLMSRNYGDLVGPELQKADMARKVLEAFKAGQAGQVDPLTAFANQMIEKIKREEKEKVLAKLPALPPAS